MSAEHEGGKGKKTHGQSRRDNVEIENVHVNTKS